LINDFALIDEAILFKVKNIFYFIFIKQNENIPKKIKVNMKILQENQEVKVFSSRI
jgi:hypothetical protein